MQSEQLPTERQVFEDEVLAGAKRADDPPEEMPERHNHGKNIIGTIRIRLCPKSFILQMYDVLARHRNDLSTNRRGHLRLVPKKVTDGAITSGDPVAAMSTKANRRDIQEKLWGTKASDLKERKEFSNVGASAGVNSWTPG